MTIELPEPSVGDVWGQELNTAIETVAAEAASAQAAADTNVSIDALDADGNPVITYGTSTATVLLVSAVGAANGAADLDASGQVPKDELGNLSYVDVGAAAAVHTHALSDVPQAARAIDLAPAMALFNTGSQKWPRRIDVTTSNTRTVIYYGDAQIPSDALPGVDLFFGPKNSGATASPSPAPDPSTTPDPITGITTGLPVVTVNGSRYTITATFNGGTTARTFANVQLAVRGPGGIQADTGFLINQNFTANQTVTLTGSGTATAVGTWTAFITYNISGATNTWANGPAQTFTISSLGGVGGAAPLLGLSGLTWNSGEYDSSDGSVTAAQAFFSWRNRPGDSIMYFTGRAQWSDLTWLRDDLTTWPGYRVISLPSQPTNMDNSTTAAGSNNAFWVAYGQSLHDKGWDDGRTIIRLNWEPNGNWYPWSWVFGGASQYVNSFKNVVTSVKTHAPRTKFIMGMNKGTVNGGVTWQTDIMNPLLGYVDIVGLDWYDHGPAQLDQSAFDAAKAQDPGANSISTYCRANGLKMSIDEWGNSDGAPTFPGGHDNPFFIGAMFDWMTANADVFVLEQYFNQSAGGFNQQIYPVATHPNSSAAYKSTSHWGHA